MSEREMGETNNYITFEDKIVKAQKAAAAKDWERFKAIFSNNDKKLLFKPFDLFGNTAIHAVARSGNKQCLKELLQTLTQTEQLEALTKGNREENTLLHEVIFVDKNPEEMVDVIMDFYNKIMSHDNNDKEPLLELRNDYKETPAFRAAKYGKLSVLKHLHANHGGIESKHFLPSEFKGKRRPILHTCVLTFNFGVAIWLLEKVDIKKLQEKSEEENTKEDNTKENEETCLKLLSKMPMAFKSTDTLEMGLTQRLIYELLPEDGYESELEDDAGKNSVQAKVTRDEESSQPNDGNKKTTKSKVAVVFSRVNYAFWKLAKGFTCNIGKIWDQKKRHKFAQRLAELLLDSEDSWKQCTFVSPNEPIEFSLDFPCNVTEKKEHIERKDRVKKKQRIKQGEEEHLAQKTKTMWETPLFLAAASGIIEVVKLIVDKYPEAISYVNEDGLNILHAAIKHRQLEIYEYIKESPAFKSLKPRISKDKRTILHQAASMEYFREEGLPGVAYQLQRELEWYHRVEEIVPMQYLMHVDKYGLTAGDLLDIEHAQMHDEAKKWMKETAQSCSTVAVLIAGVVFAAAYAIPGGSERGRPVLRTSSAFRIFTIMDVVALATSLGSVVMFLSILTSSFDLWDFHKSLPRKLKCGFIFLFFSLMTTMLAFAATILLTIRLEGNKKSTIAYSLAFVIVSIFGLTQFPLYKMVDDQVKKCSKYWKKKMKK